MVVRQGRRTGLPDCLLPVTGVVLSALYQPDPHSLWPPLTVSERRSSEGVRPHPHPTPAPTPRPGGEEPGCPSVGGEGSGGNGLPLSAVTELTFDPSTAHPSLVLSPCGRRAHCAEQKAPPAAEDPRRFDKAVAVLARQRLAEGEHYWEVQVGDKPRWALGVMAAQAGRRGRLQAAPSQGLWLLGQRDGKVLEAHVEAKEPRALPPRERRPARVGLYLSFADGVLAFYDASDPDALEPLFAFRERLPGPVFPFFDVCWHDKGRNAQPLLLVGPEGPEA